mmetsp:Transcript_74299/g.205061  ORF Transcript_74299/g.205061 Transcript_74299/m.205061 type:complete len:391 (-) Transcript_74299:103-1275(-)
MAQALDAVAETRRLIGLGHEQILRVTPESFEVSATDAWPAFRRGVVRAEGCREVPGEELLRDLAAKPEVLAFLAELAERKRGYRRQVETVLRILLKGPTWLEVVQADPALCKRLPGIEAAELLGAVCHPGVEDAATAEAPAAKLPLNRTESQQVRLEALQSSFQALVNVGDCSKPDEAVSAFRRFNSCLSTLLQKNDDADIEVLAGLEPKAPVLRLLCSLHERQRSERSRVTALLLGLLETPALSPWRAAADADCELRRELEGLGVLDHAFVNEAEVASNSGDERSQRQELDGRSMVTNPNFQAMWMWRDAGSYGGRLFHSLAVMNPARWSATCSLEETIADLEQYLDTPSGERPVKVRVFQGSSPPATTKTTNVAEAVASLRLLLMPPS